MIERIIIAVLVGIIVMMYRRMNKMLWLINEQNDVLKKLMELINSRENYIKRMQDMMDILRRMIF